MTDVTKFDWIVCGISGGKDSCALLLYLKFELLPKLKIPTSRLICTFSDTHWEAEETYGHIRLISDTLYPVIWIDSEGFENLAKRKKRFPSTRARFCTQELKLKPTKEFLDSLDGKILSVNGMRRDESKARSKLTEFGGANETYHGHTEWRPILDWTIVDVIRIHKRYDFPLNPLYDMGFARVGCMPCIHARKQDFRLLQKHFPERVDEISELEQNFPSRNGFSSFARKTAVPKRYRSKEIETVKGEKQMVPTIHDVVGWATTADHKQGSQMDFHFEDDLSLEEKSCDDGVCE